MSLSILCLYLHPIQYPLLPLPFFFFEAYSCLFVDGRFFGLSHFEKECHLHPYRSGYGWTFAIETVRASLCCVRQS